MKSKALLISLLLVILSVLISLYFYPQMPDTVASHWNDKGEADGYMGKGCALYMMPVISLLLLLLFVFIPKADPLKKNIESFRRFYDWFVILMMAFFLYIHALTIFWNIGVGFNMTAAVVPAVGFLFFFIGELMARAKRNWFVGIRTPWTLSSDAVWDKTHQMGGKLFKAAGALALAGVLFPDYTIWFVLVPVLSFSLFSVVYSYWLFSKETKSS